MVETAAKASTIGVDWGTSSFRAFLFGPAGQILDRVQSSDGILAAGGDYKNCMLKHIGPWCQRHGALPIILSGMIGSKNGWYEAPYLPCPRSLSDLAVQAVPVILDGQLLYFVPGLSQMTPPDVMRGEETQLLGALHLEGQSDGLYCLPGTHSNWAQIENGCITSFRTHMTGEVFGLLSQQGLLSLTTSAEPSDWNQRGFLDAVAESGKPGGLLSQLFQVRSKYLLEGCDKAYLSSYLSGLLIGHELRAMALSADAPEVVLVGDRNLTGRYVLALGGLGYGAKEVDGLDAAAAGLWQIGSLLLKEAAA
jgi:2-dehydro-3-deoxygalactonokinase